MLYAALNEEFASADMQSVASHSNSSSLPRPVIPPLDLAYMIRQFKVREDWSAGESREGGAEELGIEEMGTEENEIDECGMGVNQRGWSCR